MEESLKTQILDRIFFIYLMKWLHKACLNRESFTPPKSVELQIFLNHAVCLELIDIVPRSINGVDAFTLRDTGSL